MGTPEFASKCSIVVGGPFASSMPVVAIVCLFTVSVISTSSLLVLVSLKSAGKEN
jgi:hypothetical protein